jgi:group I intron endonuclease
MPTIYRCTNTINGKSYVGFTSGDLEKRIREHKCEAGRGSTFMIHKAMRKYGFDNFIWEVLEESDNSEFALNTLEEFYIRKFKTHHTEEGYNMTFGGQSGMMGKTHSEETRKKMVIARQNSSSQVRNPDGIGLVPGNRKGQPSWNRGGTAPWVSERNKVFAGRKWTKNPETGKRVWI